MVSSSSIATCEDGVPFLKFFVPSVLWICIGKYEWVLGALALSEDESASLPVDDWIVSLEPVMAKVHILHS